MIVPDHSTNVPEKSASRNTDQSGSWNLAARQAGAVDGTSCADRVLAELAGELNDLYMVLSFRARSAGSAWRWLVGGETFIALLNDAFINLFSIVFA